MFSNLKICEFKKFAKSKFGLEIRSGGKIIFRSKEAGIKGVLEFIKKYGQSHKNLIIFDKKVGNAVALLCAYLKVKEIYGIEGSKLAQKTLRRYKIKFHFLKTIPHILNKAGNDICPFEKLSFSKTPEEFYEFLNKYHIRKIIPIGFDKSLKIVNIRDSKSLEFAKAIDVYQKSMPADFQQPPLAFENVLLKQREGILKQNKATYHLTGLKYGNHMIGIADFSYLWKVNLGFMGYISIKPEFQGKGFGKILLKRILSVINNDAKRIKKKVRGVVLEVEKEKGVTVKEESLNVARIRFFQENGAFIVRGIDYYQPPFYNRPTIPLYLMIIPLDKKYWTQLTEKKIVEVIRAVYEKIYILESDVPESLAMGSLRKIITSIKSQELKIGGLNLVGSC